MKTFYGCSECEHVLANGEEFCPDHPNAEIVGPIIERELLTVKEAANRLGVDRSRIQQHITAGRLKTVKRAGVHFIDPADLEKLPPDRRSEKRSKKRDALREAIRGRLCELVENVKQTPGVADLLIDATVTMIDAEVWARQK